MYFARDLISTKGGQNLAASTRFSGMIVLYLLDWISAGRAKEEHREVVFGR